MLVAFPILFIKLLYFMYSCLLIIEVILCWVVGLFACLLKTVKIIIFVFMYVC
jgi:hypothetical protein